MSSSSPSSIVKSYSRTLQACPCWTCQGTLINHKRLHPILPLCVSGYGYGYMLSAVWRDFHFLSTTTPPTKEWLWAMGTVKNFRMFYIAHKVTTTPYLAWSQYWKGDTLSAPSFKASHLSNHQCWYSFGKKERCLFATHETASFLRAVWNILNRIHILVDLRVWWLSGAPAFLTIIVFYDRGSVHRRDVTMWWKYLSWVRNRSRSNEE
jgi:hypothetical protein